MMRGRVLRKHTPMSRNTPQTFELARAAGVMLAFAQTMSAGAGASMSEAP